MENLETNQQNLETNDNVDSTNIESTKNESESKGGDKSRTSTAIILLLALVPVTILASILWSVNPTTGIVKLFSIIYRSAFQFGMGVILVLGINEAVNFIAPKEENMSHSNVLFFMLMIVGVGSFASFSLNEFNIGLFNDWKKWLIITSIIFIVFSSISTIDIKDVMVSLFMVIAFTIFMISLSWEITSGGWQIVILSLGIAIVGDTMAYKGGKKYGKRKAFPELSPNKTIEGLIIGFFCAIIFGWIFWLIFIDIFGSSNTFLITSLASNWTMLLIIVIVSFVSPFGDLTFSKIKRSYDKKDFSNLLPGHGGLFDRLDSHIFVTSLFVMLLTMQ